MDIDWAGDEVIAFALDIFRERGVKVTVFATHETPALRNLDEELFEVGIHPRFDTVEGAGREIERLLRLFPGARGVRSHSLFQSSPILDMFVDSGLKYDCNLYLPKQEGLRPFVNWNGLIRIPYFWEDGGHMLYGDPWTPGALGMDRPGLKIFNFHPVHIFLNTEKLERYREAKPHLKDAEKLRGFSNPESSGNGTRIFLNQLLQHIQDKKVSPPTLREVATMSVDEKQGLS